MKKFLTRKRDKVVFPTRPKHVNSATLNLKGIVQPVLGADISRADYRRVKNEPDTFKRKVYFAALFVSELRKIGSDAILVGGSAVEFYTRGKFQTADIDFVVTDRSRATQILKSLGFDAKDAVWYNRELDIIVDASDKDYTGDPDKVRIVEVRGVEVKVAGVEDLIVNRLYSAKYWKSNPQRDMEEATALLSIFSKSIDNEYLDRITKQNDVGDLLQKARERASEVNK